MSHANPIVDSGHPLGFRISEGARPAVVTPGGGESLYKVEAHIMAGHQKEAVVSQGAGGSRWRLVSDEGKHLGGLDVAPFPLGLFNAGLCGDLQGRIAALAGRRGLAGAIAALHLRNFYWLTGSFAKGTGEGHAEPPELRARLAPGAEEDAVRVLIRDAINASPALAAVRTALHNTFALTINGRRRAIGSMPTSDAPDAPDPFVTYARAPKPEVDAPPLPDPIRKSPQVEEGTLAPAPSGTTTRILRTVSGLSTMAANGISATDSWLELPGVSHFVMSADDRPDGEEAPTGLSHMAAGIAFCFMTQLSRYIEHMKLDINGVRVVQTCTFSTAPGAGGRAGPVHTHLFLNGRAEEELHENLMRIAARTCYLHATLAAALKPGIILESA